VSILKSICAALVFAAFCQAATSYTGPVSGSSFTVLNSTTGVSIPFAIALKDGVSGLTVPTSNYSVSINGSGDSSFTGLHSSFSGTVVVQAADSSDTSASTDFQVSYVNQSASAHVYVCTACTASAFAQRTDPNTGVLYFQMAAPEFNVKSVSSSIVPGATMSVYLYQGQLVAAISVPSSTVLITQIAGSQASIVYNTTTVPTGATLLATLNVEADASDLTQVTSLTDHRPW
jgi:hypothetical protein